MPVIAISHGLPPNVPPVNTPEPTNCILPKFGLPEVLFNGEPKMLPVEESGEGTELVVRPGGIKDKDEGPEVRAARPQSPPPVMEWPTVKAAGRSMVCGKVGLYFPAPDPPGRPIVKEFEQEEVNGPTVIVKAMGGIPIEKLSNFTSS